jgi:uncharacterized protein YbaP (TraB family)
MVKRILAALIALLYCGHAFAAPAAHPALWKVQGKGSTVYLLGSVHLLSPDLAWRDARIEAAIGAADAFFFETPLDTDGIQKIVAAKGSLPPGQSLRALLPPQSQRDLDADLAALGLPEANIDGRRPWLAQITMLGLQFRQAGLVLTGVDLALIAEAQARGKPLRYFETTEQQMALIAPDDRKLELQGFEGFLKDFRHEIQDITPMMDAWASGDAKRLGDLVAKDFAPYPALRKTMFDDRNAAWTATLRGVLDEEHGTFLVTVGAGHLAGDRGVPALLRAAGYTVTQL